MAASEHPPAGPTSGQAPAASANAAGGPAGGVSPRPATKPGDGRQPPAPAAGTQASSAAHARPLLVAKPIAAARAPASSTPATAATPATAEDEPPPELIWLALLRMSPPWLTSFVFHMVVMILLAVANVGNPGGENVDLLVESVFAEAIGDQLEFNSPLGRDDTDKVEEPILTPKNLPPVEDPFAAPPKMDVTLGGSLVTGDFKPGPIGLALSGRQAGSKATLLGRYGGTATTESAVRLGLEWLKRNQQKDGSWSLKGPYAGGLSADDWDNPHAATAMALLALQGAGHTHLSGDFKEQVAKGVDFLLREQQPGGDFFRSGRFNHRFYTHGQCTIVLCELFGMTRDERLKGPAEAALKYCVETQCEPGGWRYTPNGGDSDLSVTGWILMALQSARMADLPVPNTTLRRITRYLDSIALEGGARYPYQAGKAASPTMTAEGLLCRMYLGWTRDDERLKAGIEWLTQKQNLLSFEKYRKNVYYWYYATQACHHVGGEAWATWNEVMRQAVPARQVREGKEKGSWDPSGDEWATSGGRLYTTCLSLCMLEVYYRHLPIYGSVYEHGADMNKDLGAEAKPKPEAEPKLQDPPEAKPPAKPQPIQP